MLCDCNSGLYWNHVPTSCQVGCIDKSWKIIGIKQHNIYCKESSQWNSNSGIPRYAPESVPQWRLLDQICFSPLQIIGVIMIRMNPSL